MRKIWSSIALGNALALTACSTVPQRPVPVAVAPPEPAELPYRWTQGNAPAAYKAMRTTLGRASLAPGEYVWAANIPAEGETKIVADLLTQMAYVYRGGNDRRGPQLQGKKGKENHSVLGGSRKAESLVQQEI